MSEKEEGGWSVEFSPEVLEQMEADPKLKEFMRGLVAAFHQANAGVESGQYKDMKEGIESITGGTMDRIEDDDDE